MSVLIKCGSRLITGCSGRRVESEGRADVAGSTDVLQAQRGIGSAGFGSEDGCYQFSLKIPKG